MLMRTQPRSAFTDQSGAQPLGTCVGELLIKADSLAESVALRSVLSAIEELGLARVAEVCEEARVSR